MFEREPVASVELLEGELRREQTRTRRRQSRHTVLRVLLSLLIALFVAGLYAAPVLRISGDAMAEALRDGDIAVGIRSAQFTRGEPVFFRYKGGLLIKRLIAQGGDVVDIARDGRILVNGEALDEPYVSAFDRGNCDMIFPLTVPEGCCFVVGDNRALSIDSRSTVIGCVEESTLVGRMLLRLWPLPRFGLIR